MEITGIGGGIMLAIAAVLWLVYLMPTWLKRREFAEHEFAESRKAERSLAMTVDAPKRRSSQAPPAGPVAVGRPVVLPIPVAEDPRARAARRLRRTRVITALVLFVALAVIMVQVGLMVGTGAVAASWVVVGIAGVAVVGSLAMLGRLAEVSRQRRVEPVQGAARRTSLGHRPVVAQAPAQPWTPVAVPKPLYLSHQVDAPTIAAAVQLERDRIEAAAELVRAAAAAEEALRAVQATASPLRPGERSFASMGIIDDDATSAPDLDAMLARRRAVG